MDRRYVCNPSTVRDTARQIYGGVYIPKPRKAGECAPSGCRLLPTGHFNEVPLQVLSTIYEQDFLSCSFGGRTGRGAHAPSARNAP